MLLSPRNRNPPPLPPSPVPSAPSPVSVLHQASGVEILGGTITSAGANVITINNGPGNPSGASQPPNGLPSPNSLVRASTVQSTLHESQVYAKYLFPKKHGYPLWIPQPPSDLPPEYTQKGISIGDVGIITPDGAFDFLFNVLLPASHPINDGYVPEGFVPLRFGARDIRVNEPAWDENTCVSSHFIQSQKVFSEDTCSTYIFTCTASNGAILTLPKGAFRQDLRNMNALAAYAMKNALSWYKYMNEVRGWEAPNGTLYIITGCDKTSLWGNASFSNAAMARSFDLRFRMANPSSPASPGENPAYLWEQTIFASTKSTPRRGPTGLPNQCVFLRGFQIRIRESVLAALISPVTVTDVSIAKPTSILARSKYIPFGSLGRTSKLKLGSLSVSDKGAKKHKRRGSEVTVLSLPTNLDYTRSQSAVAGVGDTTLVRNFSSYTEQFHPSDIINAHLLEKNKNANVAITHDNVWMSLVNDGDRLLPPVDELLRGLDSKYETVHNDEFVYLSRRSRPLELEGTPLSDPNLLRSLTSQSQEQNLNATTPGGELSQQKRAAIHDWVTWQPSPFAVESDDGSTWPDSPPANVKAPRTPSLLQSASDSHTKAREDVAPIIRDTLSAARHGFDEVFKLTTSTGKSEQRTLRQLIALVEQNQLESGEWRSSNGRNLLSTLAERGRRSAVDQLLNSKGVWPDSSDSSGRTALSFSAEMGHSSIVSLLLTRGADINSRSRDGRTPLSFAAQEGHANVTKILLEQSQVEVDLPDRDQRTPLSYAAQNDQVEVMHSLLGHGANLNSKDANGRTPFSYAAEAGHVQTVWNMLARQGLLTDLADGDKRTPLFHAAINGHVDVLQTILSKLPGRPSSIPAGDVRPHVALARMGNVTPSASVFGIKDRLGRTCLSYAAERGHVQVVELLLRQGVDVNSLSNDYRTPLSFAAGAGDINIVALLLNQLRIDVNLGDKNRRIPLAHAAIMGHAHIIPLLLKKDSSVNSRDVNERTPLSYAAENGHLGTVNCLLSSRKVLADLMDRRLRTPLSYAAEKGHIEIMQSFLKKSVDPNFRSIEGRSPISFAAGSGQVEAMKVLLAHPHVLCDSVDKDSRSPLSYAAEHGHLSAVELLTKIQDRLDLRLMEASLLTSRSGAREPQEKSEELRLLKNRLFAHWTDIHGRTPLFYAVQNGHEKVVDFFIQRKFDATSPDNDGRTPLSWASEKGLTGLVDRLLQISIPILNLRDKHGRTPLSYAASNGQDDVVANLLQNKASPNTRDINGRTPLSFAAQNGCLGTVWSLLGQRDIQVDAADHQVRTPLSYAAETGQTEIVYWLLQIGNADPNLEDINHRTPLSFAAEKGHTSVVYRLLERENILNSLDKSGKSPLTYAKENGHIGVLKAFLEKLVALQEVDSTKPFTSEAVKRIGPPANKLKDAAMLQKQAVEIRKEMLALGSRTDSSLTQEDAADRQLFVEMLSHIDPRPKGFLKRVPYDIKRYKDRLMGTMAGRRHTSLVQ